MKNSTSSVFYQRLCPVFLAALAVFFIFYVIYFITKKESNLSTYVDNYIPQEEKNNHGKTATLSPRLTNSYSPDRTEERLLLYDPKITIKSQLPTLAANTERSNPYATCVLAQALDLCRRRNNGYPLKEYSREYLQGLKNSDYNKVFDALRDREEKLRLLCADLSIDDVQDSIQVLFQSALTGHPRSMAMFASLPGQREDHEIAVLEGLSDAHREYAEKMLNRAAEMGDLDAITNIAIAYSSGEIISAFGNDQVKRDDAKAIAAMRALKAIGGHQLRKRMTPDDLVDIEKWVQFRMGGMSQVELRRLADFELAYLRAYRSSNAEKSLEHDLIEDFPEESCKKMGRT